MAWAGPLAGVRLADFCWWGVGALCTRMLADFGAEVIKIEDRHKMDMIRTAPPLPGRVAALGQVGGEVDPNTSGIFNNHNRNKLSIVINMRDQRGRELCRRLIAKSDVVSENFRPGVMERWGLDYEALRAIRGDIIFARLSGLGHSGPESPYGTAGPVVQALCGLTAMAGLPGREPSGWGYSYMDNTAAYYGTIAIMLALYHKRATGLGQEIDVSAVEAGINLLGPDLLDFMANQRPYKRDGRPEGNRLSSPPAAPHGVYPTNEEDRWIAIAVFSDAEWEGLLDVMARPAWANDPRFATLGKRLKHQDELDAHLAEWTSGQERYDLMTRLQATGVPASVVQTPEDRCERDPQIRLRELFPIVDHPVLGPYPTEGLSFKMSASPPKEGWRGAPCLGEHTALVLTEVLGMSSREVDELAEAGVI
ncbi:MAG TPA: CoA transferase [Dehalococcoidia bacterium]|nr:CoA transferase [Dehalococcoidia bacterium]